MSMCFCYIFGDGLVLPIFVSSRLPCIDFPYGYIISYCTNKTKPTFVVFSKEVQNITHKAFGFITFLF